MSAGDPALFRVRQEGSGVALRHAFLQAGRLSVVAWGVGTLLCTFLLRQPIGVEKRSSSHAPQRHLP